MTVINTRQLSDEQAVEIHRRYANRETMAALAKEYKISKSVIFDLVHGKNYKNLCLPPIAKKRMYSAEDIRKIRQMSKHTRYSDIARMMGTNDSNIHRIMKGLAYKDVK